MVAWAIDTMIAVSLLMLAVLALRGIIAERFGADWAYALWLLPALRLVMPPLGAFGGEIDSLLPPITVLIPAEGEVAAPSPPSGGPGQWVPFMLALWAGGAAIFIIRQLRSYRAFLERLSGSIRPATPAAIGGIAVIESEVVDGPLAIGLLDRRIVVPPLFEYRYSAAEQQLALDHELIHHRRGDLWWNGLALGVLAASWFNPIAHVAFRAFRTDQELACDAAIARRAPERRQDYARALVKSASRPGLIAACPLNSADQLKRRLKMMNKHRKSKARTIGGAAVLGALLLGGLGLSAPGIASPDEPKVVRDVIVKRIGKDGKPVILDREAIAELRAKCEGRKAESDVVSGDAKDKFRTHIIICSEGENVSSAELNQKLVTALEKARGELRSHDEMTPERRADAIAALEREIERLRSGGD